MLQAVFRRVGLREIEAFREGVVDLISPDFIALVEEIPAEEPDRGE